MQKQEFEERIGETVSQKDYSVIEMVYTWHPSISETQGKDEIATLYKQFGMTIINQMLETAAIMQDLDAERSRAKKHLEDINKRIGLVAKGNLVEEQCRKDAESLFVKTEDMKEWELAKAFLKDKYGSETATKVAKELE